jgi:hypothetical protein
VKVTAYSIIDEPLLLLRLSARLHERNVPRKQTEKVTVNTHGVSLLQLHKVVKH